MDQKKPLPRLAKLEDGSPFVVTAEPEAFVARAAVTRFDGLALDAQGALKHRGGVDPAEVTELAEEDAPAMLRAFVDRVFAGVRGGPIALSVPAPEGSPA